jgi:hypothetical protein
MTVRFDEPDRALSRELKAIDANLNRWFDQ